MSTQALIFYTHPHSRGRVARWALEETGLRYTTEYLEYGTTMKSPEYLAINPMGKVPALKHGEVVVTENAAIAMYLADLVPDKQLAPPPVGSPERGSYYRWISFMGPLEQAMMAKAAGAHYEAMQAGFGTVEDTVNALDAAIGDAQRLELVEDLVAADQEYRAGERYERDRAYWRDRLTPLPEPTGATRTAQYLNSGILPNGSSTGLVSRFAAAS